MIQQYNILVVGNSEALINENIISTLILDDQCRLYSSNNFSRSTTALSQDSISMVVLLLSEESKHHCLDLLTELKETKVFILLLADSDNIIPYEDLLHLRLDRYIVSPYHNLTIQYIIDQNIKDFNISVQDFIFVKDNKGQSIKLETKDILYLTSDKNYTTIITSTRKLILKISLTLLTKKLDNFIRVHQKYSVNKNYITKVHSNNLYLNNIEIPIGRTYKKDIVNLLSMTKFQ